jgi:hypothetical protein
LNTAKDDHASLPASTAALLDFLDFQTRAPVMRTMLLKGTYEHPEAIEITQDVGHYEAQLTLATHTDDIFFASLDIWHKIDKRVANVYFETRAARLDDALLWLESRYEEWRQRANSPKHRLRLVKSDSHD